MRKKLPRRLLSVLLALTLAASLCALPVFADASTTTYDQTCKDMSANTEIYRVTDTPSASYPYYGMKWEPTGGTYFGRIRGGSNSDKLESESAGSLYYSLGETAGLEAYVRGLSQADKGRVLLVNVNFDGLASDCPKIKNGDYDAKLVTGFDGLAELTGPVFLRIGAEVNCWENMPTPASYIAAFRHIAALARAHCPNVALVFAPNFSSAHKVDMDSFYPGDDYVDWIGVSLYYNYYAINGDTSRDAFYGVGPIYGDPLLNVQQVVNLAKLHSRPIIITEGGAANTWDGKDLTDFAADRIQRAYSYLTMLYPQIKCMIYSDASFGSTTRDYTICDNATLTAAYEQAVEGNPTLLASYQDTAQYYSPLSDGTGLWQGEVRLAAYTYSASKLTAAWYIDGVWQATKTEYPYTFTFDTNTLAEGAHTITVAFSNGESKSYTFSSWQHYTVTKFRDVRDGAYYVKAVLWALENNITTGTTDATFSPDETCTRAQVVTFLWRALQCPEPETSENPFTDVNESGYAYKAILWAYESGITKGTTATTFSPKAPCTRAQVVSFLWRAEQQPAPESDGTAFTDVSAARYYYTPVCWAYGAGVAAGTSATTFSPEESCTRGQIVTFLYRDFSK